MAGEGGLYDALAARGLSRRAFLRFAVATTAAVGAIERLRHGQVEVRTGLLFAAAGIDVTKPVITSCGSGVSAAIRANERRGPGISM